MPEVLRGDAYRASLRRSEAVTRERCNGCRFQKGCDGWPAHTAPQRPGHARCHVAHGVQSYIERYLRHAELDSTALRSLVATPAGTAMLREAVRVGA
jgi:hypothetical protein